MSLNMYRKDWRAAGEAAYAFLAAGTPRPIEERPTAIALRMNARATGNYGRAIRALEAWTDVEWEDGEPRLGDPLGQGITTAALADLLRLTGQPERANALAQALLDDIDVQTKRYGRGEVWLDEARSLALMLLDRPDDALAVLQRMAQAGVGLQTGNSRCGTNRCSSPCASGPNSRRWSARHDQMSIGKRRRSPGCAPTA